MKRTINISNMQKLIAQRNGYLVLAAGLVILCILLSIITLNLIGRERIIITPPVVHKTFWVDRSEVSPEYLSEMTSFFAQLKLTKTSSNAVYQSETLLRYTDSSYYGELKNALVAEDEHLNAAHISLAFYPVNVEVNVPQLMARITGDLKSTVGDSSLPPVRVVYQVKYRYDAGRLLVKSFQEDKEEKSHA